MKAGKDCPYSPEWRENVLVVRCSYCHDHPGARYDDGSGKCEACSGAAWITLANREPAPSEQEQSEDARVDLEDVRLLQAALHDNRLNNPPGAALDEGEQAALTRVLSALSEPRKQEEA